MVPEDVASKCGQCPRELAVALLDDHNLEKFGNPPKPILKLEFKSGQWEAITLKEKCHVAHFPANYYELYRWRAVVGLKPDPVPAVVVGATGVGGGNWQSMSFDPCGLKLMIEPADLDKHVKGIIS